MYRINSYINENRQKIPSAFFCAARRRAAAPHSPDISFQRGEILLIGFAHIGAAFFSVRTAIPGRSLRTACAAMRAGRTASAVAADALSLRFLVYQICKHACDGYADNNYRYNFKRSHNMPLLICYFALLLSVRSRPLFPAQRGQFYLAFVLENNQCRKYGGNREPDEERPPPREHGVAD